MPLDDVRQELGRLWARLGPFWGISPATARVYALLLTTAEPLDGEAIADELEMSRGSISMACRELADWGLIHVEHVAGSRRVSYRVEDEPEKVIRGIVATRKRREWDPLLDALQRWTGELAGDRSADAQVLRKRLADIEGLMQLVDGSAKTFLEGGWVPRLALDALVKGARAKAARKAKKKNKGKG